MNKIAMNDNNIDVSFVMTVYNKEYYLPSVLKALLNQSGVKNPEFIFIDDVSKDKSVEIIEEMTKNVKNVTIVKKKVNEGISKSINRGIMLAKGTWVRMLDSDDIFPLNSTEKMLELALKHHADMVYGNFIKTGKEPQELTNDVITDEFHYDYYENALETILTKGHFTRMGQLIKRSVLQEAGGADTRVFIQDETIPLRAGRLAHGIIKMQTNVVLVPKETNNLSKNTHQLDHDRFFAHYYMLTDFKDKLEPKLVRKLYAKTLSDNWKFVKKEFKNPYFTQDFVRYLSSKIWVKTPDFTFLEKVAQRFDALSDVLRCK